MRPILTLVFLLFSVSAVFGQDGLIKGIVSDKDGKPIPEVIVGLEGSPLSTATDKAGNYMLTVPSMRRVIVHFSHDGMMRTEIVDLMPGVQQRLDVRLVRSTELDAFILKRTRRPDSFMISLDPRLAQFQVGPTDGITAMIKGLTGTNNEGTNQYSVRGGNFDENLVYVNDFEINRPYLMRSGQQEGLSFVNSDMVDNIAFSVGGFQAKYGDKMSSVLDVTYKRPSKFAGTAMASLLGASLSLEGASKNQKLSYIIGARQKSNQYFLQSQPTKGVYNPSFTDIQALVNYRFNPRWEMEVIGNYARNRFSLQPEESTTSFGVIDQAYQLRIFYTGSEIDQFDSRFGGISITHKPAKDSGRLRLKLLASAFQTDERETYDINGEYLLGALETDLGKESFGQIKYAIGTGMIQNFARNYLKINVGTLSHRGWYDGDRHHISWGLDASVTSINDQLHQWERRDSAGFTQPYSPDVITMRRYIDTRVDLNYMRFSGFLQDNFSIGSYSNHVDISAGVRVLYSDLNGQTNVSPRVQAQYHIPDSKTTIKAAAGVYVQPPFYREMRAFDGSINTQLRAQQSIHYVLGMERNFGFARRPLRLTLEAYYKDLRDLVPYVYEDVRIRYSGKNNSNGYAYGGEMRLYGELVKDATSYLSIGLMNTKEDLTDDFVTFKGADGSDSATIYPGFTPRPNDQRAMFGLYLQDYLPRNKNFKVHLNLMYSTGLPFYQADNARYGTIIRLPDYKRVDIGFSALLLDGTRRERPRYSLFSQLNNVWLSAEVFNLLGIQNTLSYTYVQDQTSNRAFAVPNRLTSRLLNVKLVVQF
jgi:hypothetical protein